MLPLFRGSLLWTQLLLSVVFLPAQATVNRIADRQSGDSRRQAITAGELLAVAVGLLVSGLAMRGLGFL